MMQKHAKRMAQSADKETAKKELRKAVGLDPKFQGADEARETLKQLM